MNASRTTMALGLGLLWSISCSAEDTPPPRTPMRTEAIAVFRYGAKPDSLSDRTAGNRSANIGGDPVDSNVVMMDPVIVRADRGLSAQQFRTMDSSLQQQARTAADQKFAIVKVHEVKLSRKLYFGYVTLFGVPVAAGFSW